MYRNLSLPVVRHVVLAALVGSTCGAAAGLWSVGQRSKVAPVVQTPASGGVTGTPSISQDQKSASGSTMRPDPQAVASTVQTIPPAAKPAAAEPSATHPSGSVPSSPSTGVDNQDVMARARSLAQRPDVKALVALRESVVRRAAERGETGSASSKQQLDELDRYLEEARLLRLKLDAQEFRHAETVGSRPR